MVAQGFEITKGEIPVVLHVPHSSRSIPPLVREGIVLSDQKLQSELDELTDSHTDLLAQTAIANLSKKPWIFKNTLSRLVIDPERFPNDREVMNRVGMGAVYLKTSTGSALRSENFDNKPLITQYFEPYANSFTSLIADLLQKSSSVLIIDVHSYRVKQHQNAVNHGQARPAICLGTDQFHTPIWLSQLATECFSPIGDVIQNQPYAGSYVPLAYYGSEPAVLSIMLECRADQLVDELLKPHAGLAKVADGLTGLISKSMEKLAAGQGAK